MRQLDTFRVYGSPRFTKQGKYRPEKNEPNEDGSPNHGKARWIAIGKMTIKNPDRQIFNDQMRAFGFTNRKSCRRYLKQLKRRIKNENK